MAEEKSLAAVLEKMFPKDDDDGHVEERDYANLLVMPHEARTQGGLRNVIILHLWSLVGEHNNVMADMACYIMGREPETEFVRRRAPYIPQNKDQKEWDRYMNRKIDVHKLCADVGASCCSLDELPDETLLAVYNLVLLQLRKLRLPDPMVC